MKPLPPSGAASPYASAAVAAGRIWLQEASIKPRRRANLARRRSDDARDRAEENPVADRLDHERQRTMCALRAGLGLGDGEPDEQQGHADPVVEPRLDVQSLPDAGGKARIGDDGLTERGIGRGEDDREDQDLRRAE